MRDDVTCVNESENKNPCRRPSSAGADELIGRYFPVLDHGFMALKDYMGEDASVADAARTSYQEGTRKMSDDAKLIKYLKQHDHGTPFEFVQVKFHCQVPIFVARQWMRHRIGTFNELSGRYSVMPLLHYMPKRDHFTQQSTLNKQGRDGEVVARVDEYITRLDQLRDMTDELYRDMLEGGVARELARIDLPLSTYTNFYWTLNMRSLYNFMTLRCDSHAQWETRQYANMAASIVKHSFPVLFTEWYNHEFAAAKFSRQELIYMKLTAGEFAEEYAAPDPNEHGLSEREIRELCEKLNKKLVPPEDAFRLRVHKSLSAEEMTLRNKQ